MDDLSKEDRRKNMQNIRSKNTVPELLVMNELKKRKIYFAKHVDKMFGKPDIVFRRKKIIVFIDSDFWHYNPQRFIMPATNVEYWEKKIKKNRERDKLVNKTLRKDGWIVLRFWESNIKKDVNKVVDRIQKQLEKVNN
ncbi:MAG: very short patch repair endonuclease [Treponema sp.]|jgi:DNA mismatch endonuclease (patch repair protein)|nr:very short patch repair endonuclease [Treponema sp.]